MAATKKNQDYARRIQDCLDRIEQGLGEDISLEQLAQTAGFSPFHFHRIFTSATGESLGRCVRRLRLEQAARLISGSQARITDVAFEVGFASLEGFERAFNSHFNVSPSQYRQAVLHGEGQTYASLLRGRPSLYQQAHQGSFMDVVIKTLPPLHMVCLRHVGPYQDVGPTWQTLCSWAMSKGLFNTGVTPVFAGIGYDPPASVPASDLRYDACISVPEGTQVDGDIRLIDVAGGEFAVTVHKGPYSGLEAAYQELYGVWLPQSGRQLGGCPGLEIYLNTPDRTPPEELLTELRLPLAPEAA